MALRLVGTGLVLAILAGCATTSISPDLTASAGSATAAATVANSVDREVLRARLLGLVDGETILWKLDPSEVSKFVCLPSSRSVELTAKELGAYADAINAVSKVATKPTDTSYAGYLQQFKKNQAVIDAPELSPEALSAKDAKQTGDAQSKCRALLEADMKAHLTAPVVPAGGALGPLSATITSLDALLKAILAGAEQVQRDVAVHRASADMLVTIKAATAQLVAPPGTSDYTLQGSSGSPASRLGNTLAIHRWIAAQRLAMDWGSVVSLKDSSDQWRKWHVVDGFVNDASAYVTLSGNDPNKLLDQLTKAISNAESTTDKTSIGDVLDSFAAIGTAVSGISDKYAAFRKTLD